MHGLTVLLRMSVLNTFPLKDLMILIYFSAWLQLFVFFSMDEHFLSLQVWIVSSNIGKVVSANLYTCELVFRDFNFHHKDQLTFFRKNDRSGEFCNFFLTQMIILRLTFEPGFIFFFSVILIYISQRNIYINTT